MKAGLWFLAVTAAVPGLWALFAPRSFFDDFPGFGFAWVALEPPFNQHLVTDVGAFYCAFALLFGIAALRMDRRLTIPLLVAWLVFSVPHLVFHLFHLEGLEATDAIGQSVTLGAVVLIPLLLLPLVARSERF